MTSTNSTPHRPQPDDRAEPRLGVDIGRVIINGEPGADTTFFGPDEAAVIATPGVDGAAEGVRRLVDAFEGRVWLISKCGRRIQERSLRWLEAHDWWDRTGMDPSHVRFCRARPDKRGLCLDLGITHMVDDHPEVHTALEGAVAHRYLFGAHAARPEGPQPVPTWGDAVREILATLGGRPAPQVTVSR